MLKRKKIFRGLLYFIGFLLLLMVAGVIYVKSVSKIGVPKVNDLSSLKLERTDEGNGMYTLGNNWFRKSKSGLYELYVEGEPFERGVINGKLTRELVVRQEEAFSEQINKMVPSKFNRGFLKDFIGWFNRDLDKNVTDEYKKEIYGISESASDKFQYLGTNYQRLLNYHAAHDIGHALQNMALVGCTSFGTWGARSADSTMIIGRNFDFYAGDRFAEDKIVAFFHPSQGHRFMIVTWGGFIGAVSGMNEKGLSVTINAAKTAIPTGSATPVSLVTREILQYAGNISEAIAIAKSRKMFVSESFLVASAADGKAVIIEKTPDDMDVYDPQQDYIVCANHFQSKKLARSEKNIEQMNESASPYRYNRLMELLNQTGQNTVQHTAEILRDRKGMHGADIGDGNEKAINQLMAHHSIIFEPKKLLVWVSTAPWQLGQYVAYDLKKVFNLPGLKQDIEITDSTLRIAPDSFLLSNEYRNFQKFRKYKQQLAEGQAVPADSIVASNPRYYHAWVIAADHLYKMKEYSKALKFYKTALTLEIATRKEADHIHKQVEILEKKLH